MKQSKNRKTDMATHAFKYTRHFTSEGYYCFYCSDPADTLDHVPPLSIMDSLSYEKRKKDLIPAVTVACCRECNTALGDRRLTTVQDRLLYLESYYEAYLNRQRALWTEEEIEELGPSLQASVRHRQEKLNRYVDKIRAIQLRLIRTETHPTWADDNSKEQENDK